MRAGIKMDNLKFGKYLAQLRKEKGWTQEELAEQLHVTNKAISKWERGAGFPDIQTLEPLAEVLDVNILELLHSEKMEEMKPENAYVTEVISEVADIVEQQKRIERRNFIIALTLMLAVSLFLLIIDFHLIDAFLFVYLPLALFLVGIVLIVFAVRRRKRKIPYKAMLILGIILLTAPLWPPLLIIALLWAL